MTISDMRFMIDCW